MPTTYKSEKGSSHHSGHHKKHKVHTIENAKGERVLVSAHKYYWINSTAKQMTYEYIQHHHSETRLSKEQFHELIVGFEKKILDSGSYEKMNVVHNADKLAQVHQFMEHHAHHGGHHQNPVSVVEHSVGNVVQHEMSALKKNPIGESMKLAHKLHVPGF